MSDEKWIQVREDNFKLLLDRQTALVKVVEILSTALTKLLAEKRKKL
jgi:hypothetical protein